MNHKTKQKEYKMNNIIKNSPILNAGYQFWNRYTDITVSGRAEFWWAWLTTSTIGLACDGLGLWEAYLLISFCPWMTLYIRRLHDTGKSAWNLLWLLLPIIGVFLVIYMFCQPTDEKARKKYMK